MAVDWYIRADQTRTRPTITKYTNTLGVRCLDKPSKLHERPSSITPVTWVVRFALVSLVVYYTYEPDLLDAYVSDIWFRLSQSPVFKWDSFEPTVAVLSFVVFIFAWWLHDFGARFYWHKLKCRIGELLEKTVPVGASSIIPPVDAPATVEECKASIVASGLKTKICSGIASPTIDSPTNKKWEDADSEQEHKRGKGVESSKGSNKRIPDSLRPMHRAWHTRAAVPWEEYLQYVYTAVLFLGPLYVFDYMFPRRHIRLEGIGAPSFGRVCGEIACALVLYDTMFYFWHRYMHSDTKVYRYIHAVHHKYTSPITARETIRLSIIELWVDSIISVVSLNVLFCHPLSRCTFNIVIVYLLTELHCGSDYPWMPHNVIPFNLITGPKIHGKHHRSPDKAFAKFFTHWDALLGTA